MVERKNHDLEVGEFKSPPQYQILGVDFGNEVDGNKMITMTVQFHRPIEYISLKTSVNKMKKKSRYEFITME